MRVQRIKIEKWRHFQNIEITVPDDAPVVCVVGPNGVGKSHLLELIAAAAHRAGLSPGYENTRGDPFGEHASFEVTFFISAGANAGLDKALELQAEDASWKAWDRTLTVGKYIDEKRRSAERIAAGGVEPKYAHQMAGNVVNAMRNTATVHYMFLDADRSYPKININPHQIGDIFQRNWSTSQKDSSFKLTRTLYEEWFQYFLGAENQRNNAHIQAIRRARAQQQPEPAFVDQFEGYRSAIQRVLPHLLFVGVDSQNRQIHFDSTGIPLTFDHLSGGEREIAFLIGQIERFGLRKGLLLVDEPELHLNYDLLRSWIGFLKGTVEDGQIWLATHSLEVVEATGQQATFLLERDHTTRAVIAAVPLSARPIVATLSRAVGSPAFSISNLSFVLIEGEESVGERERFRLLCGTPKDVRFLEGGSCGEVIRRQADLRRLAEEGGQEIRVGGIVDGDWRDKAERESLSAAGLHVLAAHEIENLYLHPPTLQALAAQLGQTLDVQASVQTLSDDRAGLWIFNAARTHRAFADFPPPSKEIRQAGSAMKWSAFEGRIEQACADLAAADAQLDAQQRAELAKHLIIRARIYERKRTEDDLWLACEGKEVFRALVPLLQFSDQDAAERAIQALWQRDDALVPAVLNELKGYVAQL